MATNDPAPRRDHDGDNIAAVPVAEKKPFNWLYLTPLLLLLLIPFCNRRDDTTRTVATPSPAPTATATASPTPLASPAASVANRTADATRTTTTTLLNPFAPAAGSNAPSRAVFNFDANATTPNTDATGVLRSVADYLKANPASRVSLRGYTDSSGSAEANRKLTAERVANVKGALTGAGVDAARIDTANFGEGYPVTDNASPQAREMNRRVEVELLK